MVARSTNQCEVQHREDIIRLIFPIIGSQHALNQKKHRHDKHRTQHTKIGFVVIKTRRIELVQGK